MKTPKDLHKYIPTHIAAARLINLAVQHILTRPKCRVKWQIKLSLYYPKDALKDSAAKVIPVCGTFGSGDWEEEGEGKANG